MKTSFSVLTLMLFSIFCCRAQYGSYDNYLDTNQVKALFNASADMFNSVANKRTFYMVPKDSGVNTIYSSSLWIGALDDSNNIHIAAMTYRQSGMDFWSGPLDTITGETNIQHAEDFDYIWKISKNDIQHFINHPTQIPDNFKTWPAHGTKSNNFSSALAPFIDADHDGIYNPSNGDYPSIKGDQALYWIFNDNIIHTETLGLPLGIEVHVLAWAYDCPKPPFNMTIYVHYKIINRSKNNYSKVHIGQWTDFDIGNGYDDYVGSDSANNLFYGYNGVKKDNLFGEDVPAQGVVFLNQKLTSFIAYKNDFTPQGNPQRPSDYYYLVSGMRNDSNADINSKFMFNGDPATGTGFTEANMGKKPYDRRGVGSCGPFTMKAGESIDFDIAFVTGIGTGDYLENVTLMKENAEKIIKAYYMNQDGCYTSSISNPKSQNKSLIRIHPQPAQNQFALEANESGIMTLIDISGRLILTKKVQSGSNIIDVNGVNKGLYIVQFKSNKGQQSLKVILD